MKIKNLIEELKEVERIYPEINVGIKYVGLKGRLYASEYVIIRVAKEDVNRITWITNKYLRIGENKYE